MLPGIELLPIIFGAGELLCYENGVGCNDDKICGGDGVVGMIRFGLGVLKCVDVLGDSLAFKMVTLHIVSQCEDIEGMKTNTHNLEVDEKLPAVTKA